MEKCHLIFEEEQRYVRKFLFLRKLDVLEELLQDESVTEIMVNGYQKIFYEKPDDYIHGTSSLREEKNWRMSQKMVGKNNCVVMKQCRLRMVRLRMVPESIVLEPTSNRASAIGIASFTTRLFFPTIFCMTSSSFSSRKLLVPCI